MSKVCILAPVPPPAGGIGAWTIRMMGASLKNNWKVVVVDEQVIGGRTNFGATAKAKLLSEIKRSFKIWRNLWKTLSDNDIEVVQSCVPAGLGSLARETICRVITHIKGKKFIIHFRCTVPNMVNSKLHRVVLKRFVKKCDCALLLNDQSREFLFDLCPKQRYEVVPNFVDGKEIIPRISYNSQIMTALYTGGVIEEKGCGLIIEVAKRLPNITFRLVGKVGIDTNNIPTNVILCGEQPKSVVLEELRKADVFLFLTHFWGEGFSNALAEAMAAALPCIVTDWAANKDMIEASGGIVVESNPDAVLKAFELMSGASVREKMGLWNQKRVLEQYSQKVVTDKYVDIYESLTVRKR